MSTAPGERELMVNTVRRFVDNEVIPVASRLEHAGEYPHTLVEQMKELGLFGLNVPEEYGGAGVDYTTYARINEEISRGWMGLAGGLCSHSAVWGGVGALRTRDPA